MILPATARLAGAPGFQNSGTAVVSGKGNQSDAGASAQKAEIKFAISLLGNQVLKRGWKVTDSHLIFFGKIR